MKSRPLLLACLGIAGCSSAEWHASPPGMPSALAPANGAALVVNAPVSFDWTPAERATHYDFHVFNGRTRDIDRYYRAQLDPATICTATSCSIKLPIALPYTSGHAWRVRAGNNAGNSGWTRSTFSMVTGSGDGPSGSRVPEMPRPIVPAGGTLTQDAVASFAWTPVNNAIAYDFHLFDKTTGLIVDEVRDVPATTACQQGARCVLARTVVLPEGENHAWRVRSVNRYGRSSWTRVEFDVTSQR